MFLSPQCGARLGARDAAQPAVRLAWCRGRSVSHRLISQARGGLDGRRGARSVGRWARARARKVPELERRDDWPGRAALRRRRLVRYFVAELRDPSAALAAPPPAPPSARNRPPRPARRRSDRAEVREELVAAREAELLAQLVGLALVEVLDELVGRVREPRVSSKLARGGLALALLPPQRRRLAQRFTSRARSARPRSWRRPAPAAASLSAAASSSSSLMSSVRRPCTSRLARDRAHDRLGEQAVVVAGRAGGGRLDDPAQAAARVAMSPRGRGGAAARRSASIRTATRASASRARSSGGGRPRLPPRPTGRRAIAPTPPGVPTRRASGHLERSGGGGGGGGGGVAESSPRLMRPPAPRLAPAVDARDATSGCAVARARRVVDEGCAGACSLARISLVRAAKLHRGPPGPPGLPPVEPVGDDRGQARAVAREAGDAREAGTPARRARSRPRRRRTRCDTARPRPSGRGRRPRSRWSCRRAGGDAERRARSRPRSAAAGAPR